MPFHRTGGASSSSTGIAQAATTSGSTTARPGVGTDTARRARREDDRAGNGAVATRDGRWQLTLYLKSDRHTFIHALDLRSGVAHCIDLPLLGDLTTAGALALSPDQTTLYVAGGYMGSVATVDLSTLEPGSRRPFPAAAGYSSTSPSGRPRR